MSFLLLPRAVSSRETDRKDFSSHAQIAEKSRSEEALKGLIENPSRVQAEIIPQEGSSIIALFDYHAVYPLEMEKFISVMLDISGEDEIYPAVVISEDLNPELDPWEARFQEVKLSYKLLGIGETYHYQVFRTPERLDDTTFLVQWYLTNSLDEKLFLLDGFWYVKEITLQGKPYSYVRNRVQTGFVKTLPLAGTLMKLFSNRESRAYYDALYEQARLQSKLVQGDHGHNE